MTLLRHCNSIFHVCLIAQTSGQPQCHYTNHVITNHEYWEASVVHDMPETPFKALLHRICRGLHYICLTFAVVPLQA